jgi:hypothetical protein
MQAAGMIMADKIMIRYTFIMEKGGHIAEPCTIRPHSFRIKKSTPECFMDKNTDTTRKIKPKPMKEYYTGENPPMNHERPEVNTILFRLRG